MYAVWDKVLWAFWGSLGFLILWQIPLFQGIVTLYYRAILWSVGFNWWG